MDLYLVRHAPAEARRSGRRDVARALTPEGRRRMKREVRGLRALGVRLDRVLTSPMRRAIETAEILSPLLEGESAATRHLARAPSEALLVEIVGDGVALVGHEPWISALASWLVLGSTAHGAAFPFKKGGVLWLEGKPRPGVMRVRAALPPRVLRALGKP